MSIAIKLNAVNFGVGGMVLLCPITGVYRRAEDGEIYPCKRQENNRHRASRRLRDRLRLVGGVRVAPSTRTYHNNMEGGLLMSKFEEEAGASLLICHPAEDVEGRTLKDLRNSELRALKADVEREIILRVFRNTYVEEG